MAAVVLAHIYYLGDWTMSRNTVLERVLLSDAGTVRTYTRTVVMTLTNPSPVDVSFRIEVFAANGVELTRPPGPGGSGQFDADFGFPASATLGPRAQVRVLLETTKTTTDFAAFGWSRIYASLPLLVSARSLSNYLGYDDYIPIVSSDDLSPLTPQGVGDGTPPPPRAGDVAPFTLLEAPPLVKPELYAPGSDATPGSDRLQRDLLADALSVLAERASVLEERVAALPNVVKPMPKWWSLFRRWTQD